MIDFTFQQRQQFLSDVEGWFSTGDFVCGTARLELNVQAPKEGGVPDSVHLIFEEFLKDLDKISSVIEEEIKERFERISRMEVDPYDKLVKQMEDTIAFMSKTMIGSAKDKESSMKKISDNLMSAVPPREEGNENLTLEQFCEKTLITATVMAYEASSIITIYIQTPHFYSAEDGIMLNWHKGKIIGHEECEDIISDEFNSQDGIEFKGIKFIGGHEVSVTKEELQVFENELGWELPSSYKDYLLTVNGGTPALAGDVSVPGFAPLTADKEESLTLRWWNFTTDLVEYVKAGFFTFADAGVGCGGHTSIYLKPGKLYGKIFSWYWDDCLCPDEPMDSEINQIFLSENKVSDDFAGFLAFLENQPAEDDEEDKVEILEWLKKSKKHNLGVLKHKESVKFVEKIYKKGAKEVFTDQYLDEDDENVDDFEIILPNDKELRLSLESWFEKKNWDVDKYEKTHWNVTSRDFEDIDFSGDAIESMLMLKFDFIDYEEMEDWETVKDVVKSMQKCSDKPKNEIEKEVLQVFKDVVGELSLDSKVSKYFDDL